MEKGQWVMFLAQIPVTLDPKTVCGEAVFVTVLGDAPHGADTILAQFENGAHSMIEYLAERGLIA